MKIKFLLLDQHGDSLMTMNGNKYTPSIKEDVVFRGEEGDISIHELAFVTEKYYDISDDKLTIHCEIHNVLNDYGRAQFEIYNNLIKKR